MSRIGPPRNDATFMYCGRDRNGFMCFVRCTDCANYTVSDMYFWGFHSWRPDRA